MTTRKHISHAHRYQRVVIGRKSVRQNAWDNWSGYEGGKKVVAFANTPQSSAEEKAQSWVRK